MRNHKAARLAAMALAGAAAAAIGGGAEAAITVDAAHTMFRLDGGGVTYAFGVNAGGMVQSAYWGPRVPDSDSFQTLMPYKMADVDPAVSLVAQEYPGWGGILYSEPALKLRYADGVRDLVLRYAGYRRDGDALLIELKDISRPVKVTLRYTIDEATGIVGRSARIVNAGKTPIRIDQAAAAAFTLPIGNDYRLHYLTGRWAAEWTQQVRPITTGSTVLESRRGSTSHAENPWFAIDRAGQSSEAAGPVWFGALAWSGSWRISVDQDVRGDVRVVGGFNPFDFAYPLKGGEALDTPVFYAGYSDAGMGGASRLLHRFEKAQILPGAPAIKPRPVLYNSWEATEFAVDEAGQMALAEKAARIGVERFVMDDGWFGARNDDHAGLGDWTVNPKKFPNGLKPLIDKVHGLGMEFGLWVEPEMVNPDSDLYRKHPDWVISMPGRPRSEARNQLVLDLARPVVRDYVLKVIDDLVTHNDIQFLKWDHNRSWSEPGQNGVSADEQQKIYVDYVRNFYSILAELRRRHPRLEIESCASGGGRVDLGVMALTDQVWTSDNTDPFDRLRIQSGFTQAYTPAVMMAWVTDAANWANKRVTSLDYRFLVAMQGGLGVGANLNHWSDADFATATRMIAAYKTVRQTVQQGDLYRLEPVDNPAGRTASVTVSADKRQAVLFAYLHSSTELNILPALHLAGLDPARHYRMRTLAGPEGEAGEVHSGAYWMGMGVSLPMFGDFQATARVFDAVD
ncbi:alpha-galactosidase [Sphingomonas morindae]|uniref:Alpha-galactosidase n=1 Tax=Sphingomonas morindae TaxID=1541170 RepID=A0ABY4X4U6_9SPHN|nr:alpha-galactosidase [Sphingomonas morindae]USI71919.1 alpha-galactosidase [Sphingomonas morindae]